MAMKFGLWIARFVAVLSGDSTCGSGSPLAGLWTGVSRGSGFHFACRLFDFVLGYVVYVSMHLVPCFAMFVCHFRGDEVGCLRYPVEGLVAALAGDLCRRCSYRRHRSQV